MEIDLMLEKGSNLTWFQRWGRNQIVFWVADRSWLGFSVGIKIDIFARGVETDFFCVFKPMIGFNLWIKIDVVLVRVSRTRLVLFVRA